MRKFARTLASMACRTEAALNFVDELKKSRLVLNAWMTGFRQFAACEVAVPTRRKRPVELGIVPPDITLWSGGRAGEPRRTLLLLAAPGALAAEPKRLPGAPREPRFGRLAC